VLPIHEHDDPDYTSAGKSVKKFLASPPAAEDGKEQPEKWADLGEIRSRRRRSSARKITGMQPVPDDLLRPAEPHQGILTRIQTRKPTRKVTRIRVKSV
jgi:hypothetical protein